MRTRLRNWHLSRNFCESGGLNHISSAAEAMCCYARKKIPGDSVFRSPGKRLAEPSELTPICHHHLSRWNFHRWSRQCDPPPPEVQRGFPKGMERPKKSRECPGKSDSAKLSTIFFAQLHQSRLRLERVE